MRKFPTYKVLTPMEFSGSVHGDWGYSIAGVKCSGSYVSRRGAHTAMWRALEKLTCSFCNSADAKHTVTVDGKKVRACEECKVQLFG